MTSLLLNSMNNGMIADIACLAVVVIFAIINLSKGFFKQIFRVICGIGSLVLAYVFCDELVNFLDVKFSATAFFSSKILTLFGEKASLLQEITVENISIAITEMGLPQFIADFAVQMLSKASIDLYSNIGEYLSSILAHFIVSGIAYIGLFLVLKLVFFIVSKIIEQLVKLPVLRGLDTFLGLLLGVIKSVIFLFIAIYLIDVLPLTFLEPVKIALGDSMIGAYIQNNNLFADVITWVLESFKF